METTLLTFARDFGFPALLVLMLLWHLRSEYNRVTLRLTKSEDWIRTELSRMVHDMSAALRDNARAHRDLMSVLRDRPCFDATRGDYRPHPSSLSDINPVRGDTTQEIRR